MKSGQIAVVVAAIVTSGCAYSSSDDLKRLPPELTKSTYIATVEVKSVPPDVSSEFKDLLASRLREELSTCAKGTSPLRLEAHVAQFSTPGTATTVIAGGADRIRGSVQLIDPTTNKIVGDYDIARSIGWGGLVGLAVTAQAEDQMTRAFAREVCDRAFAGNR